MPRTILALMMLLLLGCQPSSKGGGAGKPQSGYDPRHEPAITHDTGPGSAAEGGRVPREPGGRNVGAYPAPPEGGPRGAGSEVKPPDAETLRRHTAPTPAPSPGR